MSKLRKILTVFTDPDGEIRVKEDNLREVLRPGKPHPRLLLSSVEPWSKPLIYSFVAL